MTMALSGRITEPKARKNITNVASTTIRSIHGRVCERLASVSDQLGRLATDVDLHRPVPTTSPTSADDCLGRQCVWCRGVPHVHPGDVP